MGSARVFDQFGNVIQVLEEGQCLHMEDGWRVEEIEEPEPAPVVEPLPAPAPEPDNIVPAPEPAPEVIPVDSSPAAQGA